MSPASLLIFLAVGALAGWIAGKLMKGSGFGLAGNVVVGIIGAIVGGWVFNLLDIHAGHDVISWLITSVAGASILLFAVGLIKK